MQMLLVFLMSAVAVCVVDVLQVLLTCSVAVYADTTCVVGMCCSTIVGHR